MDPEITSALLNYYQLKQSYEGKFNTKKLKILRNPSLSKREKRQKFLQMKKQCIKCNKEGGTIFRTNDTVLSAICGNKDNPCDLNIKINRGSFTNIREMYDNIMENYESLQNDIIKTKLNLLFSYSNEEETIKQFEHLRSLVKHDTQILEYTKKELINIIDNPQKNKDLNKKLDDFYKFKGELKLLHKEYYDRQDAMLINDMVEKYISQIFPLVTEIRLLQYKYCAVEKYDTNTYKLIQDPYTYEELFISDLDNEPAIVSNNF
jgi:hypothetical protein